MTLRFWLYRGAVRLNKIAWRVWAWTEGLVVDTRKAWLYRK